MFIKLINHFLPRVTNVNTDYVKVPIFPDYVDKFLDFPRVPYHISRFYVN